MSTEPEPLTMLASSLIGKGETPRQLHGKTVLQAATSNHPTEQAERQNSGGCLLAIVTRQISGCGIAENGDHKA